MYTSSEDARSDLFLSGAVYVIGPVVIELLLGLLPLSAIPGMSTLLALTIPVATTALVPYLLMRYRGETFGQYGYGAGLPPNFGVGFLLALPMVVASVLIALASSGDPLQGLGIGLLLLGAPLAFLQQLLAWLGLGFLGVYLTVKARDAFRSDYRTVREEVIDIGRILAMVAAGAISIALLFAPRGDGSGAALLALIVLPVLGVAAAVLLLFQFLRGPSATSRATMLTPVVVFALGPFQLSFSLTGLALSISLAAALAGIGLIIGALQESRRSAVASLGLTLAIALFTTLLLPVQ